MIHPALRNPSIATLVLASLCLWSIHPLGAQDVENRTRNDQNVVDPDRMRLEIRRLKSLQTSKVNMLESKLRADGARLNANLGGLSELRSDIRSSLRAYVTENRNILTIPNGNFALISEQIFSSLPTPASLYFANYELAEMKNMQGRQRLAKGAFENLNRQYIREAMELERLSLIEEMHKEGEPVTVEMLTKPKSFLTPEEQNAVADRDGGSGAGKIMFGTPKAGDYVTPKSKILYLLKEESEAQSLMFKPSNYSIKRLEELALKHQSAKFEPGQSAQVLTEGKEMLKIRIDDDQSPYQNFVGWISKTMVARYRRQETKKPIPEIKERINTPLTLPGQSKKKPMATTRAIPDESKKTQKLLKLTGLQTLGSSVTATDIALVWKNRLDLVNYLERDQDLDISNAALQRKAVDRIDDTVISKVVNFDNTGRESLLQIHIDSPGHPLHNTNCWVRSKETTLCKIAP